MRGSFWSHLTLVLRLLSLFGPLPDISTVPCNASFLSLSVWEALMSREGNVNEFLNWKQNLRKRSRKDYGSRSEGQGGCKISLECWWPRNRARYAPYTFSPSHPDRQHRGNVELFSMQIQTYTDCVIDLLAQIASSAIPQTSFLSHRTFFWPPSLSWRSRLDKRAFKYKLMI